MARSNDNVSVDEHDTVDANVTVDASVTDQCSSGFTLKRGTDCAGAPIHFQFAHSEEHCCTICKERRSKYGHEACGAWIFAQKKSTWCTLKSIHCTPYQIAGSTTGTFTSSAQRRRRRQPTPTPTPTPPPDARRRRHDDHKTPHDCKTIDRHNGVSDEWCRQNCYNYGAIHPACDKSSPWQHIRCKCNWYADEYGDEDVSDETADAVVV